MILNSEQEQAANAIDGVYTVIASAGVGKTSVLVERYMRMLVKGINQADILNLTFTHEAAKEMVRRVGLINCESVFRTFHSLGIEILKREKEHLSFTLSDAVIPVGMEDYKVLFGLVKAHPALNDYRALKDRISEWKRNGVTPDQAIEDAKYSKGLEYYFACAFREYEDRCREEGWLDFDGVIDETVNLLKTNDAVRNRWKRAYLAVDEFQDTDFRQLEMLELLFGGNLYCVGDVSQGIYTWRGAHPDVFKHVQQRFPGAKTLYLGENFRSTQRLVSFFKEILPVDNGIASYMMTRNEEGVEPVITRYRDDEEEAVQVLRKVTDPVNTVIMARTNRQLFIFQRICVSRGVKYKILGKKDFFETNEVRRLLHLAKESKDMRPADQVLSSLIQSHNLLHLYRGSGSPMESDPVENLNAIVRMAAGKGTIPEFLERLRKLTHARKSAKGLTLSTVHQMKGMEKSHVYLVGVNQGRMPHKDGEIGEERRIWYVACSRAAKTLNISFYGNRSEFLNNYIERIVDYEPEVGEVTEDVLQVPSY